MLIDRFMPSFDFNEIHQVVLRAGPEAVYEALWKADYGKSVVIRGLMAVRSLPRALLEPGKRRVGQGPLDLRFLMENGFALLGEERPRELVLGLTGQFWRPSGCVRASDPESFVQPLESGLARAAWNFWLQPAEGGGTRLSTETRVLCGDSRSRRLFRAYWLVVRPFSGLIRRLMLGEIRRSATGG